MASQKITRVGVIGAGQMGAGIAEVCARASVDVLVYESTRELAAAGRARVMRSLDRGVSSGKLTEREREVVCLAAKGMSNDEIGKQLCLALGTVKWHLHNIYEKLKVRNRTQAIRRVRELSLLEP